MNLSAVKLKGKVMTVEFWGICQLLKSKTEKHRIINNA